MALVAGSRGAAAIGSAGTTIGDGAEAEGVPSGAPGVAGWAAGARGVGVSAAGEVAVSVRVLVFGTAADFELATTGDDFGAAALAGAECRAGWAASRAVSVFVSTRANDGCVPTGELIAGVAGAAGGGAAGATSARGAVTGAAGPALPLSERDGPKKT